MAHNLAGKRTALLGANRSIVEMLATALDEVFGLKVTVLTGENILDALASQPPDLIVVEIGVEQEGLLSLLDTLRVHSATSAIPIIVLGMSERGCLQALASGNVRSVLSEPFDLVELEQAVEQAFRYKPFESTVREQVTEKHPLLQRAGSWLAHMERPLMLQWVERLSATPPMTERPHLTTREALDSMPPILHMLAEALQFETADSDLGQSEDAQERVKRHIRNRWQQHVPADSIVRELHILRQVLLEQIERTFSPDEALAVFGKLGRLLDVVNQLGVTELIALHCREGQLPRAADAPGAVDEAAEQAGAPRHDATG